MTADLLPALLPILPEAFLAFMALILILLGVSGEVEDEKSVSRLSALALFAAALVTGLSAQTKQSLFNGMFVTDAFTAYMKTLVLLGAGAAIVMARGYGARTRITRFEFPLLILLSTLGMMLTISAGNLMALYVGLELQSLALYILAAFRRDSLQATEAGLKYFILGALSSGLLLYGASIVYGYTGALGFTEIAQALSAGATPGAITGMVLLLCGLAFKISAVPFHMWAPDVYEGAPTSATAFFAMAPKIAGLAIFARVVTGPFAPLTAEWQQIVIALSAASMVLGAVGAVAQTNIKRLMAYSSIGHVGYALAALAAGGFAGVSALGLYAALYIIAGAGGFAAILMMCRGGEQVEKIEDLAGLGRTRPMMALGLAIVMFSMAGIPPLAGFFGKLYAFQAVVGAHLHILAVIGVLSSVIAAYYYLRIIKVMYVDDAAGHAIDAPEDRALNVVLLASALVLIAFIVMPGPFTTAADTAARALFPG